MVSNAVVGAIVAVMFAVSAAPALAQGFAEEERDWGVPPQSALRLAPYSAPTPLAIPGARTVRTDELRRLLAEDGKPLLIDVAAGEGHLTLAGAQWWPGIGHGANFADAVQVEFAAHLDRATRREKAAPLAFFCVSPHCWLSYNASLRAVALGYTRVLWFRGGVEAWRSAGLPLARVREPWSVAVPMESAPGPAGARPGG